MKNYNTAKKLREAKSFYLNFNFELLKGCKFKCPGCHVEKDSQEPIDKEQYFKLHTLITSFSENHYKPWIAFVGPTDFLVAENFYTTFTDPKVIRLFKNFNRVSFQTTYLDIRNARTVADVLKEHFYDVELEVNIVVDPAKILDDAYLARIEKNKNEFMQMLGRDDVRLFGIMNIYDYDKTKIPDLLRNYDFMHHKVQHLFQTTIDYNFSAGRNPDLPDSEFYELSQRIKKLFDDSIVSDNQAKYLRFSFGKLTDSLIERQYNYRSGKIYYSPLMYERFVSFKNEFEIPLKNYSAQEVEEWEQQLQLHQYATAPQMDECEKCVFLASCVDRGILKLMSVYNVKKCLIAKKAIMRVNNMEASPQ